MKKKGSKNSEKDNIVEAKQISEIKNLKNSFNEELIFEILREDLAKIRRKYFDEVFSLLEKNQKVVKPILLEELKENCKKEISQLGYTEKLNKYKKLFEEDISLLLEESSFFKEAYSVLVGWDKEYREKFFSLKREYYGKCETISKQFLVQAPEIQLVIDRGAIALAGAIESNDYQEVKQELIQFIRQQTYFLCEYYFVAETFTFVPPTFLFSVYVGQYIVLENLVEVEQCREKLNANDFSDLEKEIKEIAKFWCHFQEIKSEKIFSSLLIKISNFFSDHPACSDEFYQIQLSKPLLALYEERVKTVLKSHSFEYIAEINEKIENTIKIILNRDSQWPIHKLFFAALCEKLKQSYASLKEKNMGFGTAKEHTKVHEESITMPEDIQDFYDEGTKIGNQLAQYVLQGDQEQAESFFSKHLRELRKKYFTLANKYHPDKNEEKETSTQLFQQLNEINAQFMKDWHKIIENNESILLKKLLDILTEHHNELKTFMKKIEEHEKLFQEVHRELAILKNDSREERGLSTVKGLRTFFNPAPVVHSNAATNDYLPSNPQIETETRIDTAAKMQEEAVKVEQSANKTKEVTLQ